MSSPGDKWEWRPKRSSAGAIACWVLLAVGLAFVVYGLCFCRDAIERPADEFRYSFVPLFVLVSIGLILMLGGAIGVMCMEISGHSQAIRRLVQQAVGMISSGLSDHAHEMQTVIGELKAQVEELKYGQRAGEPEPPEDAEAEGEEEAPDEDVAPSEDEAPGENDSQ